MIRAYDLEFINTSADVVVSSRSPGLLPSICWGMACHVEASGPGVTIWLVRDQATTLLDDIVLTRRVAAVFTGPYTSRSLQLKGTDARVRAARLRDKPLLENHLANLIQELRRVGISEALARAMFEHPYQALVAVEFTPVDMFEQTPGPHAGEGIAVVP